MFKQIFKDKKVLITGNTGFKGSWLSVWLLKLGARVIGISKDIPTNPSMFEILDLKRKIKFYQEDIRQIDIVQEIIDNEKPDFVFHLAAQALVSVSYQEPLETISTNVLGTANILEALKESNHECVAVIITSDKCYDNVEWVWGYRETDRLGGKDIYSGSKGAAELIVKSYFHSFFHQKESKLRLGIARAGNVIGGGDWARDRIVVDCMKAWSEGKKVKIRSPQATRPWQHVLEPLSGYLTLAMQLYQSNELNGEPFNFGPRAEQNRTVVELLKDLAREWQIEPENAYEVVDNVPFHEAGLLKLNCDKALFYLKWQANLEYKDTVRFTATWYYDFYKNKKDMYQKTLDQIREYEELARQRGLKWTE